METIADRQRAYVDRLRILPGAQERLSALVARAAKLPAPRPEERSTPSLVPGCVSQVWLAGEFLDGAMRFRADADSALVKGLVAALCTLVEGLPPGEIAQIADEPELWRELGLDGHLSPTRLRGLGNVWRRLRALARAAA